LSCKILSNLGGDAANGAGIGPVRGRFVGLGLAAVKAASGSG